MRLNKFEPRDSSYPPDPALPGEGLAVGVEVFWWDNPMFIGKIVDHGDAHSGHSYWRVKWSTLSAEFEPTVNDGKDLIRADASW